MRKPRYLLGTLAVMVGCLVNYVGDSILGVRIEIFYGVLETYNFFWFLQLFILPVFVGLAVAYVFGLGGKWLCMFPPFIVRAIAYLETVYITGVPEGAALMDWKWWGFYVILAIESAFIGGIIGEMTVKRIYGRSDPNDMEKNIIAPDPMRGDSAVPPERRMPRAHSRIETK